MSTGNKVEPFSVVPVSTDSTRLAAAEGENEHQESRRGEPPATIGERGLELERGSPSSARSREGDGLRSDGGEGSEVGPGDRASEEEVQEGEGEASGRTRSLTVNETIASAAAGELALRDSVLKDYVEVKDKERATILKTRQRIQNGEHGAKFEQLPEHVSSDRCLYRFLQNVLSYDDADGILQGAMNSVGESLRGVEGGGAESRSMSDGDRMRRQTRSQQRAEERAAAVASAARGAVDLMATAVAPLARRLTGGAQGEAAALQNGDGEETENHQRQQQRHQEGRRGERRASVVQTYAAISNLDKEKSDQFELLVEKIEEKFNSFFEIWEQVRAPKYEKITRHEDEQTQKKAGDANHNFKDLPELQELLRIFPMRIETELRDKYGNITVFVVPHLGGSKMAEEEGYGKTDPDRFKELLLYFNEYLEMLKDALSEKEKRFVGVNWVWDVKPFSPILTNDFWVGLLKVLGPALDEMSRCYGFTDSSNTAFFVNTFTWYAYFFDKYRGRVSVWLQCTVSFAE